MLLSITSETWIVTGLGFGIVLALLFCLVFIMNGFGWLMQKLTAPKKEKPKVETPSAPVSSEPDEPTKAVIAAALAEANDDEAAIAMALYLYQHARHDFPTAAIKPQARNTAWNFKSNGLNNQGF